MMIPSQPATNWALLPWRRVDVFVGLLLVVVGFFTVAAALIAQGGDPSVDSSAALGGAIATGAFEVWLGVIVLWLAKRRGISGFDLGFDAPPQWRHVSTGVLGAWSLILIWGVGVALVQHFTGADLGWLSEGNALPESSARTSAVWVALGLTIVVAAPLCEELFFRGFLFRAFETLRGTGAGYAFSGAGFALMHFNVSVVIPFLAIGVLFAWTYRRSGSIWTPIAAHAIFNAVSFAVTVAGAAS
ncbi:MAG: hypothetical protein AMXMBFR23_19370 [Chloroflexota bacterium]